ncbi:MAG: DmsC/YnfH family molybdoenzyme membrane anchor subunit [Burkholderiales bacterium]|jgi:DMSO reductase anchor subunit
MKPAISVILFTVASGAGLGLAAWLLVAQLAGALQPSSDAFAAGLGLAAALVTVGLLSSTRHLANPRNAWRAFARVGSSWLSREGVLAVALYPLAALHLWASLSGSPAATATGVVALAVAVATVGSTAMIYACLKTVPRWRTWHVPAAFLAYAGASGALLWRAVGGEAAGAPSAAATLGWVLAAAAIKAAYFAKFAGAGTHTIEEALAVPAAAPAGRVRGPVRLLDAGHSHRSFLTQEFCFELARDRARALQALLFVLTLAVPAAALFAGPALAWPAAIAFLGGAAVERWLFFAQAEHVVRLYHGQRRA